MAGLIGRKIGMTNIFVTNEEEGTSRNIACTLVEVGPCVITQIKTKDNDGYEAIQIGFDDAKEKNTSKPMQGHFKKAKTTPKYRLVEFKVEDLSKYNLGDILKVEEVFEEGDFVDAVGTSKGKGFQGVVRRHGFGGVGQSTHGQHNRQRAPGSIGAASYPARVFKGLRMAGRTGGDRVKIQNLRVLKIYPEKNLLVLSGSLPGSKNSYVLLEK